VSIVVEESRLDRFETKLDRLTEAVAAMARIEEKIYYANQRADRIEALLDAETKRVDILSKEATKLAATGRMTDKAFWLLVGAVATYIASLLGIGI
jgi:predicted RNase H-like nuclease (RuvC/YqgF family)